MGVDHGDPLKPWNTWPSNGSTGSTIVGYWSQSAMSRRPKPKNDITPCSTRTAWPRNLNQIASGKPGAVQCHDGREPAEPQAGGLVTEE